MKNNLNVDIDDVRNAVADALERVGLSNPGFIAGMRKGDHDDGPFMFGAQAIVGCLVKRNVESDDI